MKCILFLHLAFILGMVSCKKDPTPENRELYFHFEAAGKKTEFYPLLAANAIAWPARSISCQSGLCDMTVSLSAEEVDESAMITLSLNTLTDTSLLLPKNGSFKFKDLQSFNGNLTEGRGILCGNPNLGCFNVQIDINGSSWSTQKGWALRAGGIAGDNYNQFHINALTKFNLNDTNSDGFEYYDRLKLDGIEHVIKLDVTFQLKLLNDWATDSLLVTNGRAKFFLVN